MKESTTKQRGDVAEYRVLAELLRRNFNVLMPVGDRLPYDLAIDFGGKLIRIQVKRAWFHDATKAWIAGVRRSQTNRRVYRITPYSETDFDVLIAWIPDLDVFYVFPVAVACSFASSIYMVEGVSRQRTPKAAAYREAWHVLPIHSTETTLNRSNGEIRFGVPKSAQEPLI